MFRANDYFYSMTGEPLFVRKLSKLRVDRSKGAVAPHKAILLVSVIQLIDSGFIHENRIFISPELVSRFKDNWHDLVKAEKFSPNFSLPFYHMTSDKFWQLKTLPGREILLTASHSIKSFSALKSCIDYAFLDDESYEWLKNPLNRTVAIHVLLDTYLYGQRLNHTNVDSYHKIELQILHEPAIEYKRAIDMADEEDVFVRSGVFKKVIPRAYNYTCCVSGMKIIATRDVQMIDACHIIPFAESHDDTIKNGISLSPNLHRAFDRFLITINDRYEVVVSHDFNESGGFPIREFHGTRIHLPNDAEFFPSKANLSWHNDRFHALQSA
jgi:putative restriction endonuclease